MRVAIKESPWGGRIDLMEFMRSSAYKLARFLERDLEARAMSTPLSYPMKLKCMKHSQPFGLMRNIGFWMKFVDCGPDEWMRYVDITLASPAALVNLPVREAKVVRQSPWCKASSSTWEKRVSAS
jgi:hypothetical protein